MNSATCQRCGNTQTPLVVPATCAACASCGAMIFRSSEGPRVLVAHESDALAERIGAVLLAAGFWPLRAADGTEALKLIDALTPPAAVVDVGLTPVMAFELLDHVRKTPRTSDIKVVLVASVYNKTAYKRRPSKLYGADDYVEQHHIPDLLPVKVCKLLDIDPAGVAGLVPGIEHHVHHDPTPSERVEQEQIRDAATAPRGSADANERVMATARSIVADIALYHQADVESVVRDGDLERLRPALDEGRRVLDTMIPRAEWTSADPLLEALRDFVAEMRRGLP